MPQPTIITRPRLTRYTGTGAGLVDKPTPTECPAPTTGKQVSATQRGLIHPTDHGPTSVHRNVTRTGAVRGQVYVSPTVRIGNWYEDALGTEDRVNELMRKQADGELGSTKVARKCAVAETPVQLSSQLVYGAPIMLQNLYTLGMLCVDSFDISLADLTHDQQPSSTPSPVPVYAPHGAPKQRVAGLVSGEEAPDVIPVTCSYRNQDPVRRNVWVLERVESWDGSREPVADGTPVCYGDKLYIKAMHIIPNQSLYLHSSLKSACNFAKHCKKHAPAHLLPFKSSSSIWQFITTNKEYILERQGLPVLAGHHVVLNHCISSNFLQVDPSVKYRNDFGTEMELSAKRGTELAHECKAWIQFVVWVDAPGLVEEVQDLGAWQLERTRSAARPHEAGIP
ncbi:hypothetical protein BCR44DRAFT_37499 [Catenaria anguillulae PL171]|uniref:Uncharacterized protein n=1 Tax=Catenaria anguillulae PL171 TaxID=765915 RepID=A0A1Y2HKS8_9FUNG|nr:hypothetical protein BCR44DRAFT_37499 [Catenaria anguillulae PL171]